MSVSVKDVTGTKDGPARIQAETEYHILAMEEYDPALTKGYRRPAFKGAFD
jgi:hypothetical protein